MDHQDCSALGEIKKIIDKISEEDPDKQICSNFSGKVYLDVRDISEQKLGADLREIRDKMNNIPNKYIEKL